MDGTSYFPSRPEMEANLAAFADKAGVAVRYGCRWTATRQVGRPRRRPLRGRDDRRRLPLPDAGRGGRRRRAVHAARHRHGAHPPLRRRPAGRDVRRPSRAAHGQAELRVRARDRAVAVGAPDRADVAVEDPPVGGHPDARRRPGALRPALRGLRPGRRGQRPRRGDRPDRARRRRAADRLPAAHRRRGGPRARGRRRHLRDRLRLPAGRPARSRGRGLRQQPAAGPDAVVGEHHRARASSSRGRSARVPRASRSTACRRTPGPSTAPATTPACWPGGSPASASGWSRSGRTWRPTRSPASSRPSWPSRPSSSTSAATSPGS